MEESLRQVIIVYEPCEQYIPYLFGYVSTWSWPKFPQTKLDELYQQWLNDHSNYDILWKTQRSSQTMRNEYMASIFMLALQKKSNLLPKKSQQWLFFLLSEIPDFVFILFYIL